MQTQDYLAQELQQSLASALIDNGSVTTNG